MKQQDTFPPAPDAASSGWVVTDLQPPGHEAATQVFDCWNKIGVAGNGTCRELLRFTHCRNCSVYSAAAAQLLDRPLIPEWQREWTEHFAKEKQFNAPARISVVLFRIGTEWLALPTIAFQEVAERRVVHSLPHRRKGLVLGLVNVRGELLICVSLGRLLGLSQQFTQGTKEEFRGVEHSGQAEGGRQLSKSGLDSRLNERLLVTIWDGKRLVFPVEEVQGICRVPHDELRDPPSPCSKLIKAAFPCPMPRFLLESGHGRVRSGRRHTGDHTVGLLDAENLFAILNRSLA